MGKGLVKYLSAPSFKPFSILEDLFFADKNTALMFKNHQL
jgi:hypothetical protein